MPAYKELKTVGFTVSRTGGRLNAFQGNYIYASAKILKQKIK